MKAAFAVVWAVLLHLTVALALVSAPPQGRPGPGAGLEVRLAASPGAGPELNSAPQAPGVLAAAKEAVAVTTELPELLPGGAGGDEYLGRVRGRLAALSPRAPIGASGTVLLRFAIAADGTVRDPKVERSSGNPALDGEALDLLRRASPLPSPPRPLQLSVPIGFRMERGCAPEGAPTAQLA